MEIDKDNQGYEMMKGREETDKAVDELRLRDRGSLAATMKKERQETDDMIKRSSDLLDDEVKSHLETKAALLTRDEFLAIASHDLRNPIGTILSCVNMLIEDEIVERRDLENWLRLIKRNAEMSLGLINDILDMERVAEGRLELQLKEQDVIDITKKSVENFVNLASAKSVLIRTRTLLPNLIVKCDRDRINQVLSNLIGNALKFTPERGSIFVAVDKVEGKARFSVSDTGPGIPLEQQRQIFGRFTQLQNKDRLGLGLGLYISRMLVEAHGGTIQVASSSEQGSTFSFSIPC